MYLHASPSIFFKEENFQSQGQNRCHITLLSHHTAVVERLYIGLTEGITATLVTNTLFSRVTHFSLTGSDVHQASAISSLDVSRCK